MLRAQVEQEVLQIKKDFLPAEPGDFTFSSRLPDTSSAQLLEGEGVAPSGFKRDVSCVPFHAILLSLCSTDMLPLPDLPRPLTPSVPSVRSAPDAKSLRNLFFFDCESEVNDFLYAFIRRGSSASSKSEYSVCRVSKDASSLFNALERVLESERVR